ncbi:putative aspartic-type endopeptidase OPSB [Fusarium oxysporum f. sp. rapae]|uniref:Putative aspartic-type endopeptidase OPSB n=1 Tax=Fusarium oxysporum f. sp. rapae TaxID=485398 RepID=A0A8J5TSU9_FUSOX|nr:putative aspartic-type endopeptidase OPSB [Fusarium oxysporum f. sp. rapae]
MRVDQQNFLYWANFTIGNPPQRLSAEIDTGNSDLLVLTNEIETCKEKGCLGGIFNPEKSNTFEWSDEQVSGAFRIGESWEGVYANDTFTLGSSTLDSFQFIGVTEFNATSAGILSIFGVGIYTLEHAEIKYPNLPYALADAGEINTPAFSLWLNNQTHGKFLFGGVKKAKYTGPLVTYPVAVDNENDLRDRDLVVMTGFETTSDGKTSDLEFEPRPVLLDSGTIQSRLTLNMTLHLIETMKVSMDEKLGAVAPCNTSSKETLDFTAQVKSGVDGVAYCKVVYYEDATDIILGDDFLRCAYVVYDWANMEISLAQYHSEEAEDEILEIMRDVPGASTAATGVPRRYLKYDQFAESAGTAISRELPTVTVTPLSTVTGSVTGSAAPSSTAAEAGDDEDNGAAGNVPANMVYMMLVVFISNVVTLA